jgi:hypothetical protein
VPAVRGTPHPTTLECRTYLLLVGYHMGANQALRLLHARLKSANLLYLTGTCAKQPFKVEQDRTYKVLASPATITDTPVY